MASFKTLVPVLAFALPGVLAAPTRLEARQFTSNAPTFYSGPYTSFPSMSTWVDFSTMVSEMSKTLSMTPRFIRGGSQQHSSCGTTITITNHIKLCKQFNAYEQYMVSAGSTWDDVGRIAVAIEGAAQDIGVDERVILGIIIEESSGYVGVQTTYNADGQPTGGLMQASGCAGHDGQNNLPQVCGRCNEQSAKKA